MIFVARVRNAPVSVARPRGVYQNGLDLPSCGHARAADQDAGGGRRRGGYDRRHPVNNGAFQTVVIPQAPVTTGQSSCCRPRFWGLFNLPIPLAGLLTREDRAAHCCFSAWGAARHRSSQKVDDRALDLFARRPFCRGRFLCLIRPTKLRRLMLGVLW